MSGALHSRRLISLPLGVALEVDLQSPTSGSHDTAKLAVCVHPWSRLGGTMDDPVLHSLIESLLKLNFHVLTFNCRGVGKSTGWPSFNGLTEAKDLQNVVSWALQTVARVDTLVIIGYSYGSLIASLHPVLAPPIKTSHILLSYPLGVRGLLTLFHTDTYAMGLKDLLRNPTANVLVVYGDRDEFTGNASYETWTNELQVEVEGDERGTLQVSRVENATHFWRGRANRDLARVVEKWLP